MIIKVCIMIAVFLPNFLFQAEDKYGKVWYEKEGDYLEWKGVFTRRGDTNTFDTEWTHGSKKVTAEMNITISECQVFIERRNGSDEVLFDYSGCICCDGKTIKGYYKNLSTSGLGYFEATISN